MPFVSYGNLRSGTTRTSEFHIRWDHLRGSVRYKMSNSYLTEFPLMLQTFYVWLFCLDRKRKIPHPFLSGGFSYDRAKGVLWYVYSTDKILHLLWIKMYLTIGEIFVSVQDLSKIACVSFPVSFVLLVVTFFHIPELIVSRITTEGNAFTTEDLFYF